MVKAGLAAVSSIGILLGTKSNAAVTARQLSLHQRANIGGAEPDTEALAPLGDLPPTNGDLCGGGGGDGGANGDPCEEYMDKQCNLLDGVNECPPLDMCDE